MDDFSVAEHGDADPDNRPVQKGTHYQIRNLRLARRNDVFTHFSASYLREFCTERLVSTEQLLSFGVEQDNCRSLQRQGCIHLLVKSV